MKERNAADTHRAECVAVVRAAEAQESVAPLSRGCSLFLRVILIDDFERDLDGSSASVGVKDLGQAARRPGDQLAGQFDRWHTGEAQQRRVGDSIKLFANGPIDCRDV